MSGTPVTHVWHSHRDFSKFYGQLNEGVTITSSEDTAGARFAMSEHRAVNDVRFFSVDYDPYSSRMTHHRSRHDRLSLAHITKGSCRILSKTGEEWTAQAGDIVFIPLANIDRFASNKHSARLIDMPISSLGDALEGERFNFFIRLSGHNANTRIISAYMSGLWDYHLHIADSDHNLHVRHLLDLCIAFGRDESAVERTPYNVSLLNMIKDFIIGHIDDENLGIPMICAHFSFTSRYLHRIFAGQGMTVSEWIKNERLNHCQDALLDTSDKALSVKQIAYRFGFTDSSHFCRTFKARFGVTPTQFRTAACGTPQGRGVGLN